MKITSMLLLSTLFVLTACSTTPKTENQIKLSKAASDLGYKCKKTFKTGSHISSKRCTTKKKREEESRLAKKAFSKHQTGGPKGAGVGQQ